MTWDIISKGNQKGSGTIGLCSFLQKWHRICLSSLTYLCSYTLIQQCSLVWTVHNVDSAVTVQVWTFKLFNLKLGSCRILLQELPASNYAKLEHKQRTGCNVVSWSNLDAGTIIQFILKTLVNAISEEWMSHQLIFRQGRHELNKACSGEYWISIQVH